MASAEEEIQAERAISIATAPGLRRAARHLPRPRRQRRRRRLAGGLRRLLSVFFLVPTRGSTSRWAWGVALRGTSGWASSVSECTGRFEAHLWNKNTCTGPQRKKKGRQVYLGAYGGEEAATRAYDLAALKYWGSDTVLNFPLRPRVEGNGGAVKGRIHWFAPKEKHMLLKRGCPSTEASQAWRSYCQGLPRIRWLTSISTTSHSTSSRNLLPMEKDTKHRNFTFDTLSDLNQRRL